ncbi:MAG: hypothetical protein HQ526_08660 [Actinobacteria bacterium]|nr:hypothetical protein [Actinomycetota bacterium]
MRHLPVVAWATVGLLILTGCGTSTETVASESPAATSSPSEPVTESDLLEVPAKGAPTVSLTATPDSITGWNINIETRKWTWTPGKTGGANEPNAGHGHLYFNGEKITRIYGPWYFLSDEQAAEGDELSVTLNGNDHSPWAVDGQEIGAKTALPAPKPPDQGE